MLSEKESHAKTQKALEKLEKQYDKAEKYIEELEANEKVSIISVNQYVSGHPLDDFWCSECHLLSYTGLFSNKAIYHQLSGLFVRLDA